MNTSLKWINKLLTKNSKTLHSIVNDFLKYVIVTWNNEWLKWNFIKGKSQTNLNTISDWTSKNEFWKFRGEGKNILQCSSQSVKHRLKYCDIWFDAFTSITSGL